MQWTRIVVWQSHLLLHNYASTQLCTATTTCVSFNFICFTILHISSPQFNKYKIWNMVCLICQRFNRQTHNTKTHEYIYCPMQYSIAVNILWSSTEQGKSNKKIQYVISIRWHSVHSIDRRTDFFPTLHTFVFLFFF